MIIDFDKKFRDYLMNWMQENADKYENPDDMEGDALDVYSKWLKEPADWIDNVCPADYFKKCDSAEKLVDMLVEYLNANVGIPDLLLDEITERKTDAKAALTKLFNLEFDIADNSKTEAQMLAVNMLAETDDSFLYDDYIELLLKKSTDEEVANLIIERLKYAKKDIADKILKGLESISDEETKTRCMDVLVNFPGDDRIYNMLIGMFNEYTNTSFMAAYLGKYGDDRAINMLEEALDWQDINYLDYIEIRNSIEQLGKDVDHIRSFEGDTYYESLKNI